MERATCTDPDDGSAAAECRWMVQSSTEHAVRLARLPATVKVKKSSHGSLGIGDLSVMIGPDGVAPPLAEFWRQSLREGTCLICFHPTAQEYIPQCSASYQENVMLHMITDQFRGTLVMAIPAARLHQLTPYFDLLSEQSRGGNKLVNDLICRYVEQFLLQVLRDFSGIGEDIKDHFSEQVCHLLVRSLENDIEENAPARTYSAVKLHRRAMDYIKQNIEDPRISPARIAKACGISLSYLHKLFNAAGTSVNRTIIDLRLQLCRRRLCERKYHHIPISTIAFDTGFNNSAHFSSCFKKRFGVSPRECRAWSFDRTAVERRA